MNTTKLLAGIAAVLLCGITCSSATASVYSRELVRPEDFADGIFERAEVSAEIGGVTLGRSVNCVPFVWVPSPDDGVVSKIDARSGAELARYRIGPADSDWTPCTVAVSYDGSAFVACGSKGAGKIVKINASGASKSTNRASEQTSFDVRGNKTPDALAWGADSRVSLVAEVGGMGSTPSALAFGTNGLLWVGLWSEQSIVAVDVDKKAVVATVPVPGKPESMLVDSNGSLWVLCGNTSRVCQVDMLLGTITNSYDVPDCGLRSMALGENNVVWLGSDDGLVCLNTATGSFTTQRLADGAGLAGVVLDKGGDVWAACPVKNELICFSSANQSILSEVPVGRSPGSVSLDEDGYIWALNGQDATTTRVDPRSSKCAASVRTGRRPYSSTPFAASSVKRGVSPSGSWRKLLDSKILGAAWGTISWAESSCGGHITVEVRTASTPTAIEDQSFVPVINGREFSVPDGEYLEVKVSFTGGNNTSPILRQLVVQGRNLAPDVSQATPTTDRIMRLDHKFETVGITGVTDPEGDPVTVKITNVTQDEPVWGLAAGDKWPDAVGVGSSEVKLRAECDLGQDDTPGNGRVYTVTFKATDALGASTTGKVKVLVPAVLRWDASAVEDDKRFDSTREPEKEKLAKA